MLLLVAARADPSAVVLLDAAGLPLGLRDAALRDLFVRTTTIRLFPPPFLSQSVSSLLCSLLQLKPSQSLARSLARSSVNRESVTSLTFNGCAPQHLPGYSARRVKFARITSLQDILGVPKIQLKINLILQMLGKIVRKEIRRIYMLTCFHLCCHG